MDMETIFLSHPHRFERQALPPTVMALGYFDGIHLGHQKVIRTAVEIANERGYESAVMTFHPHPSVVLGKQPELRLITPLNKKEQLVAALGVNRLYIVEFTPAFANLPPEQFADQYLDGLHVKHVVAGFDFTYGRFGKGTMETMPLHARGRFGQTVVPKLAVDGEKVSSTRVRKLIEEGAVDQLPRLLGRFYDIEGTVVAGEQRGRTIGFPTANIALNGDYLLPAVGVYAVKATVGGRTYEGVANIGYKPTFHAAREGLPSVEVHLFAFARDIYGETVTVEWHRRLRSERKFAGVAELAAQIARDKEEAKQYFRRLDEKTCILPEKEVF
ncbi:MULTISPECIES: bifunctional riboflavin kinase/FAD synthetase [Geobacillus]|uniref:Riboflavin biosynthesis protein n=1 Tax=Geobacillus stearothermophilus TaxID=1422 RepID=A0A150M7M9_GEOSE|nr:MULTISPECIES: bifunctional riboflavin kinase/FAD synthetase [Geobacillus]ASS88494.1 riboflavin biosynthesis protein RibF [Geobacillus lituanicus]MED0653635.1 bifunctional riboflavin kinase/FAD synthetase [Anoxybacillus geothermalis]ATA59586.1 riboflavin kinase RibF [Geobacillus stearothermophilus]KOR94882.1 riboflavin biosynthesis protein RibF [Geobacillus stearothermophilus ATCC 12980]KYD20365.1 Riboflavin kinase [Geobacillus stearothermophilus]